MTGQHNRRGQRWVSGRGSRQAVGPFSKRAARSVARSIVGGRVHRSPAGTAGKHRRSSFGTARFLIVAASVLAALYVIGHWVS